MNNIRKPIRENAAYGYLYAQSSGEWGVEQHYTASFENTNEYPITVAFYMKGNSSALMKYNVDGSWKCITNLGVETEINKMFSVNVDGKSKKEIDLSYITSAGGGYCEHYFEVKKEYERQNE